jgi:hypothetical protein
MKNFQRTLKVFVGTDRFLVFFTFTGFDPVCNMANFLN